MADISDYIPLQRFQMAGFRKQNRQDLHAIITVSERFINKDTDLIAWTNILIAYGLIDKSKYRDLQRKLTTCCGSRQDEFLLFLGEIVDSVSFEDFLNTIYKQGMIDFAEELRAERQGQDLLRMGSADVPFARRVQTFYCSMKQQVDNGIFKSARKYLKDLTIEYKANIKHSVDPDSRQYYAEKLVAVYVLMLPQYTTFDKRKKLLDDMKQTFHRPFANQGLDDRRPVPSIDSNSADIVYSSKMAITVAMTGDFKTAKELAEKADHLSSFNKSSLARTLAYHDHQFIYLLEYWKTGAITNLSNNLRIGDTGLRMILEEPDEVRNQWNRLLMLYKTLSLLGIHPNVKMTRQYPDPKLIEQAKEILKEVRGSFDGIETRRKMIYSLCMARAHERTDSQLAITYTKKAIKLSSDRTTFYATETSHLRTYLKKLKWLHLKHELCQTLVEMCGISSLGYAVVFVVLAWLCVLFII